MSLNLYKFLGICLIVVAATVALLFSRIDAEQWLIIVLPFGGYLIGNGVAAKTGQQSSPAIGPKSDPS